MRPDDQALRDRLRLKYIPFDPTPELIEKVDAFFAMSDAEQAGRLEIAYNEEAEFLINIMTARALYKDPVDRQDGSITEAKVARYPDRYGWNP